MRLFIVGDTRRHTTLFFSYSLFHTQHHIQNRQRQHFFVLSYVCYLPEIGYNRNENFEWNNIFLLCIFKSAFHMTVLIMPIDLIRSGFECFPSPFRVFFPSVSTFVLILISLRYEKSVFQFWPQQQAQINLMGYFTFKSDSCRFPAFYLSRYLSLSLFIHLQRACFFWAA